MKKIAILLLVAILTLGLAPLVSPVAPAVAQGTDVIAARLTEFNANLPKGYGVISVDDLNVMLTEKTVVLLDVRQPEEYQAGHLGNSFNVPLRELGKNLALLPDLNAEIVVICKGGYRAALAAVSLQILGYKNTKILKGGFDGWVGEDMPVVMDPFTVAAGTAPAIQAELLTSLDGLLSNLPKNWDSVAPKDLAAELVDAPPLLLDVRAKEEWDKGYIEGASHIWINEFMARLAEWPADKNAKIVVYCASGYRAAYAKIMMNMMGYTNVRNLSGGTGAWAKAGFPFVGAAFSLDAYLTDYLKTQTATFGAMRVADLAAELKTDAKPFLLDVRTADEYVEGFIEGAINIPLQDLTANLSLLPKLDENIVVYCGSGHRSAVAMTALQLLGYTKVRSLLSGVGAWKAGELPLVNDLPTYAGGDAPKIDANVLALVDTFLKGIPKNYNVIKPADLNVLLAEKPPFLLDVRTEREVSEGRIQDAVAIPLSDLMARAGELPTDKAASIVVYDNPTHRSSVAMVLLQLRGYTDVKVLGGGTGAWTKAELPLVK